MVSAYVLINCDLGTEEDVVSQLKTIDGIKEFRITLGEYDIIAKVESDSMENLQNIIIWRINKMKKIARTLTLMTIAGQE